MGILQRAGRRPGRRSAGTLAWAAALMVCLLTAGLVVLLTRNDGSGASGAGSGARAAARDGSGPVVSLTFNSGTRSQYEHARPLLRQHGMNGTFYVTTDRLDAGEECCTTWAQVRQLYREGDEIGGFSADGVDLTVPWSPDPADDYARKQHQVCAAHSRLAQERLDPRSFAYPAGAHSYEFPGLGKDLADLVASCHFGSGRIIGGLSASDVPAMTLHPADPYVIRTPDEVSPAPLTLADLQQAVTQASTVRDGWVPLVLDEVCSGADAGFAECMATRRPVQDTVLADFLGWLSAAGRPDGAPAGTVVRTVRSAMGAPPPPPLPAPRTVVSLTFDDGDVSQELAARLMDAHGAHGTFYVNSGPVDAGDRGHMSWAQLLRLHREGHDIGGHTTDHVDLTDPGLPDQVKHDQVCQDHDRLVRMGLDPRSFAYPYGALDPAAEDLVESCGYASARSAGSVSPDGPVVAEDVPPPDPFATRALDGPVGPGGEHLPLTLDYLQRAVVSAADAGGGWVQIVLHHLCSPSDAGFTECMTGEAPIEVGAFADFLDWLRRGAPAGTTVRTVREVMEAPR